MSVIYNPKALAAVADAADQILGAAHPIAQGLRRPDLGADDLTGLYGQIEALPADQRRILAGMVAEAIMPGLASPSGRRH